MNEWMVLKKNYIASYERSIEKEPSMKKIFKQDCFNYLSGALMGLLISKSITVSDYDFEMLDLYQWKLK